MKWVLLKRKTSWMWSLPTRLISIKASRVTHSSLGFLQRKWDSTKRVTTVLSIVVKAKHALRWPDLHTHMITYSNFVLNKHTQSISLSPSTKHWASYDLAAWTHQTHNMEVCSLPSTPFVDDTFHKSQTCSWPTTDPGILHQQFVTQLYVNCQATNFFLKF